jgi:hypothetical protein
VEGVRKFGEEKIIRESENQVPSVRDLLPRPAVVLPRANGKAKVRMLFCRTIEVEKGGAPGRPQLWANALGRGVGAEGNGGRDGEKGSGRWREVGRKFVEGEGGERRWWSSRKSSTTSREHTDSLQASVPEYYSPSSEAGSSCCRSVVAVPSSRQQTRTRRHRFSRRSSAL